MAFNPTKQQQNAIDAAGNVLVSAAAGSGKTAVLVERVIRLAVLNFLISFAPKLETLL